MPKAPRKTFDLAAVIASELAKSKPLEIVAGDKTFTFPPPVLWPDEVFEVNDIDSMRLLLGDDYEAFVAAGGTAKLFFGVILPEWQGATLPESPASTD
jgi:hypothetical protein